MGKLPVTSLALSQQAVSSQAFKVIDLLNFREGLCTFRHKGHRKQIGHEQQAKRTSSQSSRQGDPWAWVRFQCAGCLPAPPTTNCSLLFLHSP